MLPAIGSVSALAGPGKVGVVVSARPIGEPENGRQLVSLRIKASDADRVAGSHPAAVDASPSRTSDGRLADRPTASSPAAARPPNELSPSEKAALTRLQQRDQQVKQEEKAHAAVAGDLAGPINYIYQRGPDGRQYAVGGSVGVQASNVSGDPEAAKRLGARLAAAANAATNPSAQDYAMARQAYAFGGQLVGPEQAERRSELNLTL
jgi:hypothetical protein